MISGKALMGALAEQINHLIHRECVNVVAAIARHLVGHEQ